MPDLNEADIGKTKAPFQFREERNTVFYHDVRVFIYGADISPWLTSAITLTKADRNGISSLSFELSNVNRAFEITATNIGQDEPDAQLNDDNKFVGPQNKPIANFRMTDPYAADGMYSELAKANIFKKKVGSLTNWKHQTSDFGVQVTTVGKVTDSDTTNDSRNLQDSTTFRYPMNVGSLVFHKYDPIRFFVKNPLSNSDDEWICKFTGYVDVKPFSQNYVNGQSVIRITCQDIRVLLQNMRMNTNPSTQVGNENLLFFGNAAGTKPAGQAGFFNDFIVGGAPGNRGHSLFGKTFVDSLKFLLLGQNTSGSFVGRVGKLTEGITMRYNPESSTRKQLMEKWNNIVEFGAKPLPTNADAAPTQPLDATSGVTGSGKAGEGSTDLHPQSEAGAAKTLAKTSEFFLTKGEMLALGRETFSGGRGDPDVARVHFLLPHSDSPLSNLVAASIVDARATARVEWATRLELINNLCKSIDYQFYVSGMGDVIIEFPQYDFLPIDYSEAYNQLYTFKDHLMSDSINDEGGTPISGLEVTSRDLRDEIASQDPDSPGNTPIGREQEHRRTIFSNVLASRVGVHVETLSLPGITDNTKLAQYGMIEFNKRLANYNKFDMNTSFRPYIGVNRPIYHVRKARMAITESITYTWRVRQDATLEMALMYTRKLEGQRFRFITGGQAQPISYNYLFGKGSGNSKTHLQKQGVEVSPAGDTDPNALDTNDSSKKPNTQSDSSNPGG